jgi:putative multiple sugar transport system permease protein
MDQKLKISEVLKKYTMIIALAVIVILFTVNTGGKMLLPQNVNNLIAQNAYVFILATGMLFCILTGGNIDLSVGSVVCFVGAIGGKMMVEMGISPYLTLIAMAIMGMLVGAWQGFWIAYVRIPPFIVTLAGMLMFRGLSNVVLQGMTLAPIPDQFLVLFNTYVPDFFAVEGFNLTCFLVGVIACVVYAFIVFNGRRQKLAKGYYVELQARTLFEEGWSEVDHDIVYPYFQDDVMLKDFSTLLNRLSGMADEMSSYFRRLKEAKEKYQMEEDHTL